MLMGGHLEVILWGSSGASSVSHRSKEQTVVLQQQTILSWHVWAGLSMQVERDAGTIS